VRSREAGSMAQPIPHGPPLFPRAPAEAS